MENDDLMLIDFFKNEYIYNNVTLYFGKHENTDYWGDGWNDTLYEHKAGTVYDEYVEKTEQIHLKNAIILQPCDIPDPNSGWCKQDFKKRLTPCLLIVPHKVLEEDYEVQDGDIGEYPTYTQALGNPKVRHIYYGDSYPQVINNITYDEVPENDKPKEPLKEDIMREHYYISIVFKHKFNNGLIETSRKVYNNCTIERKDDCYILKSYDPSYEVILPVCNVLFMERITND